MNVLKICVGTWQNASHDKRELAVCRELGAQVQVIAKGDITGQQEIVDGFPVTRLSARPLGNRFPVAVNRIAAIFSWASYIRNMKDVDVISGHDLSGLGIGWLSNFFKRKKAQLVYDSHEFELGRNAVTARSKLSHWVICYVERFMMKRCSFSIMVNDSIADEVQRIHKLKTRPVVARNAAYYWPLCPEKIQDMRIQLQQYFPVHAAAFIIMYHGKVGINRGIEQMLRSAAELADVSCIILGSSESQQYIDTLKQLATELGMADRVLFHPAVPLEQLPEYVAAVDVGMINILATAKSYYYMLPNKFYENIQALTPVIVSDFPEVGKIVDKYGIGLKVNPEDIGDITQAIVKMKNDKPFYEKCKKNLLIAKENLCWEKEKEMLKEAYRQILQ